MEKLPFGTPLHVRKQEPDSVWAAIYDAAGTCIASGTAREDAKALVALANLGAHAGEWRELAKGFFERHHKENKNPESSAKI